MNVYQKVAFVIGFFDLFAISIIIPQLAINFKTKGYSPLVYGMAGATYGILQTLSGPLFGGYSDVHGRKKCILWSYYLSGLVYLWLSVIDSIVLFFIARAALGLTKHTQTMVKAYLCDITDSNDHARLLGQFNAISSAGFIVGPIIGAHIGSFERGCVVSGIFFIGSAVAAHILLPYSPPTKHTVPTEGNPEGSESVIALFRSVDWPKYWDLFLGRLLLATAVGLYRTDLGYTLTLMYSLTAKDVGYLTSFMGVVAAASGFLVGPIFNRFNKDSGFLQVFFSLTLSASLVLLYLSTGIPYILLLIVVFQLAASLSRAFGLEAVLNRGSEDGVGLLHGALQSVSSISRGVIPLLNGLLQTVHTGLPTLVSATMALSASVIFMYTVRTTSGKQKAA